MTDSIDPERPAPGRAFDVDDPLWFLLPDGGRVVRAAANRRSHTRYLALPNAASPLLLLPVAMPAAARYGLENFTFPNGRLRRLRRSAAATLLSRRAFPPVGPRVTIAHDGDRRPSLVAAAEQVGVPADVSFFVRGGGGDRLARGAFFLFERGEAAPSWVMKFARVRGYAAQFDADERGLELARRTGATDGGHASRLVGRLEHRGYQASIETAALGKPLGAQLAEPQVHVGALPVVTQVAEWIAARDVATRLPPAELEPERRRLADLVSRRPVGVPPERLLGPLEGLPATVQHNDLGCWNVLAAGSSFTVVDWESARSGRLPLWDLWYFLADAASTADGIERTHREEHIARLFRGEHVLSPLLFRLTRTVVDALSLPPGAIGAVATLCWLHHSQSHVERAAELRRQGFDAEPHFRWPSPDRWLSDPALGTGWQAWREA